MNMVYKDSKKAKIIKIFQLEVGALASKIIHPEVIILSYRTGANKGRGLYSKKILWSIGAAYKQERLQLKKNFLKKNQSFNSQNLGFCTFF